MINRETERREQVLDKISNGAIDGRGLTTMANPITADASFGTAEVQRTNRAALRGSYDYVIVGAGASGSVIAGELAKSGADVLLVESGGMDDGSTISNPSVWFYNIGGPMDWSLPIQPSPRLADRQFKLAYDVTFVVDAVGGMSQLAHRTAIERLSHAGAVPNTALALVTELFRDWKAPVADKAREIIKWYLAEVQKLTTEAQKKSA